MKDRSSVYMTHAGNDISTTIEGMCTSKRRHMCFLGLAGRFDACYPVVRYQLAGAQGYQLATWIFTHFAAVSEWSWCWVGRDHSRTQTTCSGQLSRQVRASETQTALGAGTDFLGAFAARPACVGVLLNLIYSTLNYLHRASPPARTHPHRSFFSW